MIYIVFFILCFLVDSNRLRGTFISKIIIVSIYIFLCFGYMTGSDWRGYEVDYQYVNSFQDVFNYPKEKGLHILYYIGNLIGLDFWLFSGIVKALYLYSLLSFFRLFTNRIYSALGISFAFSTLFMLIDCPMRYMVGMTFLFPSVKYIIEKKYVHSLLFGFISILFHVTLLLPFMMLFLMHYSSAIFRINRSILFIVYLCTFVLFMKANIILSIITKVISFNLFERFDGSYSDVDTQNLISLGSLKSFLFLTLLLFFKDAFSNIKYGKQIYCMTYLSMILSCIVVSVPTGFRINILNAYFNVLAILFILIYVNDKYKKVRILINSSIISLLFISFTKSVFNHFAYLPYSNSIPYILTEHLPYSYRSSYNYIENKDLIINQTLNQ